MTRRKVGARREDQSPVVRVARRVALNGERLGRSRLGGVRGRDASRDIAPRRGAEEQVEVVVERRRKGLDVRQDRSPVLVRRE